MKKIKIIVLLSLILCILSATLGLYNIDFFKCKAQVPCQTYSFPFYGLSPKKLCVRSEFYTSFCCSTEERKSNIKLAASSLNNFLLDVGAEFSFNATVGERTEARGYKKAKIIVGGRFADGVGGGVCQVSTTLYNAVLLAGLKITEYHPHTLPVSYIAPSFDAMVNSGSADLRFVNNTRNPIIINTFVNDSIIRITITGEPLVGKYSRESIITETIPAPKEEYSLDTELKYPNLYKGEEKVISYSKAGLKSEGYLIRTINGRKVSSVKIRKDVYSPMRGLVVLGNAIREPDPIEEPNFENYLGIEN